MSHNHSKHLVRREMKYPIFLLGMFIIIVGGIGVQHLGLPVSTEVATVALGFVLVVLGLLIE